MAQLRLDYPEFIRRQAEIIVIGPEKPEKFNAYWSREQMPFPGVADPKHAISRVFGQEFKLLKLGRMPATIIIDKQGYIRYRHLGKSMKDIPLNEGVLSVLDELNAEKT